MKRSLVFPALFVFLVALVLPGSGFADPIEAGDRACRQDSECALISTKCNCSCPESYDAVNVGSASKYASLGLCSPAELSACATQGACPHVTDYRPAPACIQGYCGVTGVHALIQK